jgi:23S rRNA (cytidine2498-2'-O)-methyltransferase
VSLTGRRETDLPIVLERARQVAVLAPGERFCVQCRRVGPGFDYDAKDVEVCVGSNFEVQGAVPAFSDTAVTAEETLKVVSVYLFNDTGYIGFSTVRQNLNEHCDEYRVRSRHARTVSRAEYKLMEALRKFRVAIPAGRALDLGAAPGGWTRVLADAGMEVVAVDPADLAPQVAALPGVTHVRVRAEDFASDGAFDLLVNDMNVDPEQSAGAMVTMARHLRPDAAAIMTVKLVIRNAGKLLDNVRPILAPAYEVLKVKCLFHNRREVTVLLRRK